MRLSIVIPTYNEERDIGECIRSLKMQSFRDYEILIVDDGSTDNTVKIVKEFMKKDRRISLIMGEHKGPGASRNIGSKKAKGEILIFVDSDMTFDKNYLKNLIKPIKGEVIGTTHELELVENVSNIWSRCWGRVRVSKDQAKDAKIFRAIRKDKFFDLGMFDPIYGYADDQTFWFKHRVRPFCAKDTLCYHKNPETLKAVYKQSRWIGASINSIFLEMPLIKFIVPFFLYLISPLAIPLISLKRCIKIKDLGIILYMFVFITFRYFGTIEGIIRNIYFNKNFR